LHERSKLAVCRCRPTHDGPENPVRSLAHAQLKPRSRPEWLDNGAGQS
jgi:hypothetical protein